MGIDINTVRFVKMLDELAGMTAAGFRNWDEYDGGFGGIVYADPAACGYRGDDEKGAEGCYVVEDSCLLPEHHDIVGIYGRFDEDFSVRARQDDDGKWYVSVVVDDPLSGRAEIVVEDGRWYFC